MGSKTIHFSDHGRLMVVNDIHGNYNDFNLFLDAWDENDKDHHILFNGDLIHGIKYNEDRSLDILDTVERLYNKPNFHVLLGNHELCQARNNDVFKYGISQTEEFLNHISERCDFNDDPYITKIMYEEFFKAWPYFAITNNGFFISHSGSVQNNEWNTLIEDICSIRSILKRENPAVYYSQMKFLEEMLWSRPYDDYMENDIDDFLNKNNCKFMVVGHTPCNGQAFHILGNQIRFDSSFLTDDKYYLDIPLDQEFDSILDVPKCLKKVGD